MSIEELDTKAAMMAFIVEQLESEPLPQSAVAGLQSGLEVGRWNPLVFENSFANYGFGFAQGAWRSLPGRLIQVQGLVTRSIEFGAAVIATLPVKPKEALVIPATINGITAARVDVLANGQLVFQGPAAIAGSYLTLNGIIFGTVN